MPLSSSRGSKRHNLSSRISENLSAYHDNEVLKQAAEPSNLYAKPRLGRPGPPADDDKNIARRASVKLGDDVRGAVRLLCSDKSRSLFDSATLEVLCLKHPSCPIDRRPPPATSCVPLCLGRLEVKQAIRSFSPGSAGGPDGLRPQHLVDMLDISSSSSISDTLTVWSNLVFSGGACETHFLWRFLIWN